ncbi:hypothetical protein IG631_22654 [Alternaria alternata]|nr:hypothetical protein IG631_22654 [Alternaria alternata]
MTESLDGRCRGGRPDTSGSASHPALHLAARSVIRQLLCKFGATAPTPLRRTPSARSSQRHTVRWTTVSPNVRRFQKEEGEKQRE